MGFCLVVIGYFLSEKLLRNDKNWPLHFFVKKSEQGVIHTQHDVAYEVQN